VELLLAGVRAALIADAEREFGVLDLSAIGDPFAESFERFVFLFLQSTILSHCASIVKDAIRSPTSGRLELAERECTVDVLTDPERFDHLLITILMIGGRFRRPRRRSETSRWSSIGP